MVWFWGFTVASVIHVSNKVKEKKRFSSYTFEAQAESTGITYIRIEMNIEINWVIERLAN